MTIILLWLECIQQHHKAIENLRNKFMYKNLTFYNTEKSIKKYEQRIIDSGLFPDAKKTSSTKREIVYKNKDLIISINKNTVNYLVFNKNNYTILNKIESFT